MTRKRKSTAPSPAPSTGKGNILDAPLVKRPKTGRKPVDVPSEDSDKRRIVRVGRVRKGDDRSNPEALPLRVVTVAMVDRGNKGVTYYNIDTWHVHAHSVGDYSSAEAIKSIYQVKGFEPDEWFDRPYRDGRLDERVLQCLTSGQPRPVEEYDSDSPQTRRKNLRSRTSAPKKAPLRPTHALGVFQPANETKSDHGEGIDAVICFINDLTESGMRLPRNYQATLEYNESYTSLLKFVRGIEVDERSEMTLAQSFQKSDFMYWADIEIWILPQGSVKMFKWTADTDLVASEFLEPGSSDNDSHQLYIQVRIVADPDAEQKDKEWVLSREKSNSSKTSRKTSHGKRSRPLTSHKNTITEQNCASDPRNLIKGTATDVEEDGPSSPDIRPLEDDSPSPRATSGAQRKPRFTEGGDFRDYLKSL